jgi:hypothetical protein
MKELKLLTEWATSVTGKYDKPVIVEGGNIFKSPGFSKENPEMLTDRINKAEVMPTVEFLEVMSGVPVADCLLGSTGIAASSGDIDVGIDKNKYGKEWLMDHMLQQGVDPDHLQKTGDSIHYMSPIWQEGGTKTDRFVQVDFMFVPDVEFAKWSMRTAPDSSYKGVYLQKLRADLVRTANPDWKWNHFNGVLSRTDNSSVFGFDPDKIAQGLLGKGATRADLESVERVLDALKNNRGDINTQVRDAYRTTLAPRKPGEKPDPNAPQIDEGYNDSIEELQAKLKSLQQAGLRASAAKVAKELRQKLAQQKSAQSKVSEAKIGQAVRAHSSQGSKVGREFQHIEDLVYVEGLTGIKRALNRLAQIAQNTKPLEVKWDGSPAIVFGRDEQGRFHFGDKYSKQLLSTPEEVYAYYTRSSQTDSRKQFAQEMAELCPVYEQATPQNFRGFLEAGLMYKSTPPLNDKGEFYFMPNTVTYFVKQNSVLGRRIGGSISGAAATGFFDNLPELGGKRGPVGNHYQAFDKTKELVIIPPKFTKTGTPVDLNKLRTISRYAASNGRQIEQFLAPEAGLSDIRSIIYSYVNSQVDNPGNLNKLGHNFAQWVEGNAKLSPAKKLKLTQKMTANARGASAVFKITQAIMHIKDGIIGHKEHETLGSMGIRAQMKTGEHGGEGFVHDPDAGTGPTKLVNRGTFTRANRMRESVEGGRTIVDLTKLFPNYDQVVAEIIDAQAGKLKLLHAALKPGYKPTEKIVKALNRPSKEMKLTHNYWRNQPHQALRETADQGKTAVVGWGRGMGHKGHMYLAQAVIEYAERIGAQPFFFVSETVGADDPLLPKEKLAIYKTVFPKHKNIFDTAKTIIPALVEVQEQGFDDLVFIVGADQKNSFKFLAGTNKSGQKNLPFNSVKVMSRQETDTSASELEGPRATPMREVLKNPQASTEEKFKYWRDAMPDALDDGKVMTLMKLAAARMNVPIEDELNEGDEPYPGATFSPLSMTNREQPRIDPIVAARKRREERELRRWMGHRD